MEPMKRILSVVALAVLTASPLSAQDPPSLQERVRDARPDDVTTLDGIIRAYYEVVSGPAGSLPEIARDHTLHHPGAKVSVTGVDGAGDPTIVTGSLDDYYDRVGRGPRQAAFYEEEIHRQIQRFGNIAHVWSTYAYRSAPGGPTTGRGINSIQLYHDGSRWWITAWFYDSERAENPIPAEYLPGGG